MLAGLLQPMKSSLQRRLDGWAVSCAGNAGRNFFSMEGAASGRLLDFCAARQGLASLKNGEAMKYQVLEAYLSSRDAGTNASSLYFLISWPLLLEGAICSLA